MPQYEYKVIPAPAKGEKAKDVKTPEGRFAQAVQSVLNRHGAEGWEYLRSELLPNQERSGLTGSTTEWRTMLIFRRARAEAEETLQPRRLESPATPPEPTAPLSVSASRDPLAGQGKAPAVGGEAEQDDGADDRNVVPYPGAPGAPPKDD